MLCTCSQMDGPGALQGRVVKAAGANDSILVFARNEALRRDAAVAAAGVGGARCDPNILTAVGR